MYLRENILNILIFIFVSYTIYNFISSKNESKSEKLGKIGEKEVKRVLRNLNLYHIDNVYITHPYGTSEIDIVVLDKSGIYVLEVKNYSGKIFGSVDDKNWSAIYPNGSIYSFYNPILQNDSHKTVLYHSLNNVRKLDKGILKSYVIFTNHGDISSIKNTRKDVSLLNLNKLSDIIKSDKLKSTVLLSEESLSVYRSHLKSVSGNKVSKRLKRNHIRSINRKYKK